MNEPLTREQIEAISAQEQDWKHMLDLRDTALYYEARLRQVEPHLGEAPTLERMHQAHSAMPAATTLTDDPGRHRVYKQGHDEQCYICACIERAEKAEAMLRAAHAPLEETTS